MSDITAENVQESLYAFSQACFRNEMDKLKKQPLLRECEPEIFKRFRSGEPLSKREISGMSLVHKKIVFELVSQYIIFAGLSPELLFPSGFLDDCSPNQLGVLLLAYIAERSWPYPGQLPR